MYQLLTEDEKPVNPIWGKRYKSYKVVEELLVFAYQLLKEDNN